MDLQEFERIVSDTLDALPDQFRFALENVAIVIEEEPPREYGDLLGLYEGTPIPDRGAGYTGLPDSIRIFRGPILRLCTSREQVAAEIRDTVVHELGHHMGLDDHDMPY